MITNLGAEIVFITVLIFADYIPNSAVVVVIVFGYAECVHHTMDGIRMYKKYAGRGKKTIYGPGTITSFAGLIQLSTYGLVWLTKQSVGDYWNRDNLICCDWTDFDSVSNIKTTAESTFCIS